MVTSCARKDVLREGSHLGDEGGKVGLGGVQGLIGAVHPHGHQDGRSRHCGRPEVQVALLCSHTQPQSQK